MYTISQQGNLLYAILFWYLFLPDFYYNNFDYISYKLSSSSHPAPNKNLSAI